MSRKFIAVPRNNPDQFFLEDSPQAVAFGLTRGYEIDYYPITLDADGVPSLGEKATTRAAGRAVQRRIEAVSVVSGQENLGDFDVEVEVVEPDPQA